MPQFLSREMCEMMRTVLRSDEQYGYLHESAVQALDGQRELFRDMLLVEDHPIERGAGELTWWTFAGGRINTTLQYILREIYGWDIATDNLKLRVEGEGLQDGGFEEALERLGRRRFWDEEIPWDAILAKLPEYRLSKFQRVMPERAQRELVGEFLLDVDQSEAFCVSRRCGSFH